MGIRTFLHHISVAPSYYHNHFFCPVKRDTLLVGWSCAFLWLSSILHDLGVWLTFFSQSWSVVARVLSGLILVMNFVMVSMSLTKRARDWRKKESEEGTEEYRKRNDLE
jgi:hypothetical protein